MSAFDYCKFQLFKRFNSKKYRVPAHKVQRLYKAKGVENELPTKSNPVPTILFVKMIIYVVAYST